MYVCLCQSVTEYRVQELGRKGLVSPEDLIETLNLSSPECCGFCRDNVDQLVDIALEGAECLVGSPSRV